ncbi:hypothetical protein BV898_12300 [Hypsibius exemplaris]|uniref:Uncharacterized protein n=1 Tax=Hypsibius exemplaris TaxID=2072580 RepID=A0A1W0WE32_HYPEX|nr:hypothetical protein BV898_12300 [Hypsibius exemplaris]
MARLPIAVLLLMVLMSVVSAGILDSIKSVLGITSSSTSSAIQQDSSGANLPNYFRIEAELVRMDNVGGIKSTGGSCDTIGQCDPVVYAYLDVLKPTGPFPGSRAVEAFPQVFTIDDVNSPKINTVVSADVCNKELTKATLRVHVMDRNKLFTDSLISDFDCYVGGSVGRNVNDAKWANTGNCVGKFMPDKIKFVFRSRIYRIDPKLCVESANQAPAATTSKSIFG